MIEFIAKIFNYVFGKWSNTILTAPSLIYLNRKREIDTNYFDYIRVSTLELLCYEIKENKVDGNLAELGVYKGKFAQYINAYLPEKKFYLFDTFEGFDAKDTSTEKANGYSSGNQDFSNTSVENVLKIMPHRENCIIKKGYFPESASDVNDTFCLVSLDADLYEPIYNGLKFFYPKLANGGYILVHDFNSDGYKGVREAVTKFCKEENIGYFPISDKCGTVILCK